MKNNVLIVAAHPDDEVLGAGGTILKHSQAGDQITILIMSDGETSRTATVNTKKRKEQAKRVAKELGAAKLIFDHLPDQKFDTVPFLDIIQKIENIITKEIKPIIVYTHCPHDLNMDHRLVFQATATACRPGPNLTVQKLLGFETLSSTEWQIKEQSNMFCPTFYNNITNVIKKKIEILKLYKDEIRDYPHPRSEEGVLTLAKYRGMETGYKYAEAFQVIRILNDSKFPVK